MNFSTTRSSQGRRGPAARLRTPWSVAMIALVCVTALTVLGVPLTAGDSGVDLDPGAQSKCKSNKDCGKGDYCAKYPGACDELGECKPKPGGCPKIYDPVCGCDNRTYSNACIAAQKGVNVAYQGPCEKGSCGANSQCKEGFYCQKKTGDCNGKGKCVEKPFACLDVWIPVCGCDGNTYSNDCYAAANGVSVAYDGECKKNSCVTNAECKPSSYCAKAQGDCNGIGQCQTKPIYCLMYYLPTCGCDGITYGNACFAAANGANVDFKGYCHIGPGPGFPIAMAAQSPASYDILRSLDLTDTGQIDTNDVLTIIGAWGDCTDCAADFNQDGTVGAEDLLILLDWFGAEVPAARPIPQP